MKNRAGMTAVKSETRGAAWLWVAGGAIAGVVFLAYELGARTASAEHARSRAVSTPAVQAVTQSPPSPISMQVEPQAAPTLAAKAPEPEVADPTLEREPPSPEPTPLEHRDKIVAELRASGPDRRLGAPASMVVKGWANKMAQFKLGGQFEREECYAKGCFVNVTYAKGEDADKGTDVITRTGEFNGWQAGKMRSGQIIKDDGRVEVTWVLYAPPEKGPIVSDPLPPDSLDELTQVIPAPTKTAEP